MSQLVRHAKEPLLLNGHGCQEKGFIDYGDDSRYTRIFRVGLKSEQTNKQNTRGAWATPITLEMV